MGADAGIEGARLYHLRPEGAVGLQAMDTDPARQVVGNQQVATVAVGCQVNRARAERIGRPCATSAPNAASMQNAVTPWRGCPSGAPPRSP